MKALFTIVTLGLGLGPANAQTVKEADVPTEVKDAFTKQYLDAKVEEWEKEDAHYKVEFRINKVETRAVYDSNGKFIESEVEIKKSELPKGVTDYIATNLPGKKIKESSKITDATGKVSYDAEIDHVDYIFDSDCSFLKKEDEKGNNDRD